ncbi:response regulator [Microbacterium oryzae]|uniref:response regulator n=1 Tax=Microbacterium oryzae TaxID=743009 RepID=UPI001FE43C0B|nr:response regulator transcription factor [Microbacterium oryzae]
MSAATAKAITSPDAVRVVIVDDDAYVRAGLTLLLGTDPGIVVVGEAADGLSAAAAIETTDPDVVLMDIRMPRCDGIAATRRELDRDPDLAIIILTTFDADDLVVQALQAGARGFLLKDTPPDELVRAVHAAARGGSTLTPSVWQRIVHLAAGGARPASTADASALSALTRREREVAAAVARGMSNADIAAELFLSLATVKTHVGRVLQKLGVDNRVQAAVLLKDLAGSGSAER